ncbi:aminotransferase class I/II-fold pyridoxal phosphate-dependent enzyme [Sphingobium sp. AN641]|uniref:aminotransferase class I/II-fold pyridoxal phosphate-dependent enzyme n=1 Tax=Sphingobium sp. AN641 TaxID=3133443 RepID=UPI0030C0A305
MARTIELQHFAGHGGRLGAARLQFPDAARPWIDLSTGINPHAWSGANDIAIDWRALPDEGDLRALEATAAHYFGADPAHVCALPGSEVGLRLLGAMLPGGHVAPAYPTHAAAFPDLGARPGRSLILANPNNPDGRLRRAGTLVEDLDSSDGWLIVDEAFADAISGESLAGHVGDGRRLIVLRSFGKFFGLAGLRLGFLIAPRDIVADMRARLGSWPVSTAAQAIGAAAYADTMWIAAMRDRLAGEAAALDALLARHGLRARGACPLFRLIETPGAGALFERLAMRGILTRPFAYAPDWLRLGLPADDAARERLDAALAHG